MVKERMNSFIPQQPGEGFWVGLPLRMFVKCHSSKSSRAGMMNFITEIRNLVQNKVWMFL